MIRWPHPDLASLHRAGFCGAGVGIGHLDTGVDGSHPALTGSVERFASIGGTGDCVESLPALDDDGHGTHTAGIIVGVAPQARLFAAQAIEGGSIVVRLLAGLDWMLRQPIAVLTMPLGLRQANPLFELMLRGFAERDVLTVVPIGNEGAGRSRYPGGLPGVLSVGAADVAETVAAFSGSMHAAGSTRCLKPDVVAPGVAVESPRRGGGTELRSGTSMAAAFVAGLAALLRGARPDVCASEVAASIVQSARSLRAGQQHRAASGSVEAAAALARLLSAPSVPAARMGAMVEGAAWVDPRLLGALSTAGDAELVTAVLAAHDSSEPAGARVLHRFADGAILVIEAPAALIRGLVGDPRYPILSSDAVDRFALA